MHLVVAVAPFYFGESMAISETLEALSGKTDVATTIEQIGAGASGYVSLPQGIGLTVVELVPTGTARIELTFDKAVAEAGGAGVEWAASDVAARTQARLIVGAGAFIRVVNTSGNSKAFIRGVIS